MGAVTFTYNFIEETIIMQSPDGDTESVSFQELADYAEKASNAKRQISGNPLQQPRASFDKQTACKTLVSATGGGHKKLWQTALKLAGVNPWVRGLLWLGETGLWFYVKKQC